MTSLIMPAAVAFGLALLLTSLCRSIALRTGIVSQPAADRWGDAPTALLGGPAIVTATTLTFGFVADLPPEVWILLAGALAMAIVGLVDDLRPIGPAAKLTAQLVAAAAVTAAGLRFPLTGIAEVDTLVTMFWIVGLTNAFNLLDNMDGLAAGIAAIAGGVKLVLFWLDGEPAAAAATAAFTAAALGFLVHNLVPSRIFMGDSGSLFLGFFVAGLSAIGPAPGSRATLSVLIIPVVVLCVPIFDTVLVTVVRVLTGRRISQGGRDHASHRLVTAGLSERRAVFSLYALAAISGAVAIATRDVGLYTGLVLLLALALVMLILGVSLARIGIEHRDGGGRPAVRLDALPGASYYRDAANAAINAALIFVSYYAAHAFQYGPNLAMSRPTFTQGLPVVFGAKMLALGAFGTYRSVWRYTDSRDLSALVLSSAAGSALAVLVLVFAFEFAGYSRSILALDWVLFTALVAASRLSLRALSEILRPAPPSAVRVLIFGAGDAGVSLLQELRRNRRHGRTVVGFLDDDPMKQRTRVQGLPVYGGLDALPTALASSAAEEVILAIGDVPPDLRVALRDGCELAGARVSHFDISVSHDTVRPELDRLV